MAAYRAGRNRWGGGPASKEGAFTVIAVHPDGFHAGGGLAAGRTRGTKSGAGRNCDVARIVRVLATLANRDRCVRAPPCGLEIAVSDAEAAFRLSGVRGIARTIDAGGADISDVPARAAAECDADLIVMGTHGRRGARRALLGSVAESLVRIADRPVLVVRAGPDACAGVL
ncbi:universal stress protein [Burkholderia ambifaria]|uniref:universal stress protein n=1 Tax=Burkholderia ambifaria TaxID=152480 RepID=UPI003394AE01